MIAFISYLTIVMLIGVVGFFLTRNLSDYVLGGRSLGGAVAALSAGASDMSSWLLMGLPGLIYTLGLQEIWISCGLTLGAYICWRIMAKRLRIYSEIAGDSLTIPAFLDNRFKDDSKLLRVIAGFAILVFFVFYIASGLYAGGLLLSETFALSYIEGLAMATVIIMLYTAIGGFLAVSWTDFFQGSLMLVCLLLVPFFVCKQMGGITVSLAKIQMNKPEFLFWYQNITPLKLLSNFSWGLGYFGMPHILVRFMAVKSVAEIPLARCTCMSWMALSLVGAILVGGAGAAYFHNAPINNPEMVFMALSAQVLPAWMVGIILAAILSSSMCAIDSQMLAASSAVTEDFYHSLFRKNASQKELMWVGRLTIAAIGAVAVSIAFKPTNSIMGLVSFAWAGLGATFGATMVCALFWERMTRNGAAAGMITGALTVILWKFFHLDTYVYELLPGTIFSLTAVIGVSVYDKAPAKIIVDEFWQVNAVFETK